ncbi:hypothetical protein [Paraburkholderia sp. CI3]|uniref:hypothetical protein n=1 Tax=Paraburkholderia sp. CI3 TaxID=2991060 RepID=UPI003D23BABD
MWRAHRCTRSWAARGSRTEPRVLMQAACALWAALLGVAHGLFAVEGLAGIRPTPAETFAGIAVLLACGCYWSVRGRRLLKPRRIFAG